MSRETTIGSLGQVVTGKTPATANRNFYDGPHLFVTPTDLDFSSFYVRNTHSRVTDEAFSSLKNQVIPPNSIMFTCIGNTIGKSGLSSDYCLTNQQINSVVVSDDHNPLYVYYLLETQRDRIRGIGLSGGAAQPIINKSTFSAIKVHIHDRPLQNKIADILSAYDDLIENNRRRIALLEQAARELYKEWFVRFRFPGHEHVKIVDGVPEGWERGPIGIFFDTASGGTPSRRSPEYYMGQINWVKTKELSGGFISNTEEQITAEALRNSSAKIFPVNTVLVAMYGATIGQVAVLDIEASTNQACCAFLPKHDQHDWIYMFWFLKENKDALISLGQGAAQNNISQQVIKKFEIVMPPAELRSSFADNLLPMLELWRGIEKTNKKLATARDLLLPRLMNGSIAV